MDFEKAATRKEYQTAEGFVFFTDVTDQIFEQVTTLPIEPLAPRIYQAYNVMGHLTPEVQRMSNEPGIAAAHFITSSQARLIPTRQSMGEEFHTAYGISKQELARARDHTLFQAGFGDLDFPWDFSLCVADNVMRQGVTEGFLSEETYRNLTLSDWAAVIDTPWLRRMVHSMALTRPGVYRSIGSFFEDFHADSLHTWLQTEKVISPTTEGSIVVQASEDTVPVSAQLSKETTVALRKAMKAEENSMGCPVARYMASLPRDLLNTDSHLMRLLEKKTLTIVPERSTDTSVTVRQEQTTIDRALSVLATRLIMYEAVHGTPRLAIDPKRMKIQGVEHHKLTPVLAA